MLVKLVLFSLMIACAAYADSKPFVSLCNRHPDVRTALMNFFGRADCHSITSEDLQKITQLSLIITSKSEIQKSDLSGMNLNAIVIWEGEDVNFAEGALSEMENLEGLFSSGPEIKLQPSLIDGLRGLNKLSNLMLSKFDGDPNALFWVLPSLTYLRLENSNLHHLTKNSFPNFCHLTQLDLKNVSLDSLASDSFANCPSLSSLELILDGNSQIKEYPSGLIDSLPLLVHFDGGGPGLEKIPDDFFAKSNHEIEVFIDGNSSLSRTSKAAFRGVTRLFSLSDTFGVNITRDSDWGM
jgi:hypothetical protein